MNSEEGVRNLLGGHPQVRAHALPSDPCRTGGKEGHGRQAGQAAGRQTKDTFAKSRIWPGRRWYLARELRSLMGGKGGTDPSRDENSGCERESL